MNQMLNPLPRAPDLLSVARRCVWFLSPDEALDRPVHFIAQVLTYGVHDDVRTLRRYVSDRELIAALDQAPPWYLRWAVMGLLAPQVEGTSTAAADARAGAA